MKDNISPEEKLLRLIRGHKRQDIKTDKKSTFAPVTKEETSLKQPLPPFILKHLSFLNIHKIILFVFVVTCVYLIASFIYPLFGLRKVKLPKAKQEDITDTKIELKQKIRPYEFYLEGIRNRKIFSSAIQEPARPVSEINNVNVDLIKDIKLVGIISGEKLQAIIEDKKTQKTYYVDKGQFIQGMQVEDIQEGKVILNFNGRKLELYL